MSARRRRNIFQTRDERFNYRFGNPAMRKRYRVRSKRRLIIAIGVLLVLLLVAGLLIAHFFGNDDDTPKDQTSPGTETTETADTAAPDGTADQTSAETADSAQETEQTPAVTLTPVASIAREKVSQGAPAQQTADTQDEAADASAAPASAAPVLGTVHDTAKKYVDTRRSDWRLLVVNQWNHIPENFTVETLTLLNGLDVDTRCADDLDAMIDDCFNAGHTPLIVSAYRSTDYQRQLFEEQQYYWINEGYSEDEAYAKAAETVAVPGTSEHECGLAVDIVDQDYQELDEGQTETGTQQWLMEHCWEYGFVLRYPSEKKEITGVIYEPWHYRYVGREYAKEMHEKGLCLEEYVWMTDHPDDTVTTRSE